MSGKVYAPPFAQIPEWLLDADVSDRAVRLYGVLKRYAQSKDHAHPGRRALAERLRCSPDSVDRAVKELQAIGALTVEANYDKTGDRTSNNYYLHDSPEVAAHVRPPGRNVAGVPIGGREDAATGGRDGAALSRATLKENSLSSPSDSRPPEPEPAGDGAPAEENDTLIDEAFTLLAEMNLRAEADRGTQIANPEAWKRADQRRRRAELANRPAELLGRYPDLTAAELACLLGGGAAPARHRVMPPVEIADQAPAEVAHGALAAARSAIGRP